MKCECGCGMLVRFYKGKINRFVQHHHIRVPSKETRQKWSVSRKGNKHALGYKRSEKSKKEQSERQMGKKNHMYGKTHTDEWKIKYSGKGHPMWGRKHTKESILKMVRNSTGMSHTEESKRKIGRSRDKHWNWLGGKGREPYSPEFTKDLREQIKTRDNHKCQNPKCRKTTKRLDVHHIDYNKRNSSLDNLITVCASCNTLANYGREHWTGVYREILAGKSK